MAQKLKQSPKKELKKFHPRSRAAWRNWLEKNHAATTGVWLVYYKKASGKPRVPSYEEAVEEALCFGWIDSLPRKLDQGRAMLKFSPRKPGSVWSSINKARVEKIIRSGQVAPAGLSKIEKAKADGSWELLDSSNSHVDLNSLPPDLVAAFSKNKKALNNFRGYAATYRRQFLFWIDSAKRPETRKARIQQTLLMAAAGRKPGLQGFK